MKILKVSHAFAALAFAGIISSCQKELVLNEVNDQTLSTTLKTTAVPVPTGIYAVQRIDKPQDDAVLQNPYIDGIFIRTKWSSIESVRGMYNWSFLDSEIDRAIGYNKKIEIAIMAGEYTPSWVESKGVLFLDFKVIPHSGEGNPHWTHLPIVWDTRFISYYNKMIKEFAIHLKTNPNRYNAISLIKINGVNQETAETRLPYQDSTFIQGPDTASNCAKIWAANGYTQAKVVSSWQKMASNYNYYFPDKPLGIAIIGDPRGFPSIDDFGNIIPEEQNVTTQTIVDKCLTNDKSIILFNALTEEPIVSALLNYVIGDGGMVAYQEKECYPAKSDAWVESVIKNGIANGAEYIELFNETILAYPYGVKRGRSYFPSSF